MSTPAWELTQSIFLIIGGLGMFLYGIKILSDGLEIIAGNQMRSILERATSNRFRGVAVGAVITAITQSSTAASVMIVGFINAGLMNLTQAISLIMGAKIGATLAAHIIAFRIDTFAPLFIFVGFLLHLMAKKIKIKNTGYILLSVGILFFGLSIMSSPLKELSRIPSFQMMLTAFRNPLLAVLAGFVFTAIIQSSTAATGILVTMYLSGIDLPFTTAAFIVLGINIGTTVTSLIASLPARRESKRAALAYFIFVTIGCIAFGTLIFMFPDILQWFQNTWHEEARQIAMFHTLFNMASALLLLPFIKQLSALLYWMLPKQADEGAQEKVADKKADNAQTLEPTFSKVQADLQRMAKMASDNMRLALEAFYAADSEKAATVMAVETKINSMKSSITSELEQIRNVESSEDTKKLSTMLRITSDIERIGDHAENLAEYATLKGNRRKDMHSSARDYLHVLSDTVIEMLELTLCVLDSPDMAVVEKIDQLESRVDDLARECLNKYIQRQEDVARDPRGGIILANIASDLERSADHAVNIAKFFQNQISVT